MREAEIDRLRADIETIREAGGLDLPFGWEDVCLNLATVPCGVILAAATGAIDSPVAALCAGAPGLGVFLSVVGLRYRFRRSTGRSPARRREYDLKLGSGLLFGLLTGVFLEWARSRGQPAEIAGGCATAMAGALCAVLATTSPGRRYWSASALGLIAYGLVSPLCSPPQLAIAGGVMMAASGVAAAAIQARQLRRIGRL
jgi:hypothetical protein